MGSRPHLIVPEKVTKSGSTQKIQTTQLFAQGKRNMLRQWCQELPHWQEDDYGASDLKKLETISAISPLDKLKGLFPKDISVFLEVILHFTEIEGESGALKAFSHFLAARGLPTDLSHRFYAKGLCFLKLRAPEAHAPEIASYSLVRVVRKLPALRMLRPPFRSEGIPGPRLRLPETPVLSESTRVAIFDGGIPADHPLTQWVTAYEFPNMLPPSSDLLSHGIAVTSAALFGHIDDTQSVLPQPYAAVDHYRVLDNHPDSDPYQLFEVLDRILVVLENQDYDFVSLSIGPCLPVEDDDVHTWTAVLDDRLAKRSVMAAIAVGNGGESDQETGLNRIQVPSDCVNALAVGACDTPDSQWKRATYSSVGPGRSPGLVKPDLVSFGGSITRPFVVLSVDVQPTFVTTGGTSLATPNLIRIGSGVRSLFGRNFNHLAIETLLIHTAESKEIDLQEIGRGRCAQHLDQVVICADDEIRVVYQGEISPAKYVRASLPMPDVQILGKVDIKATACYKSQTDPHHPGNYTRAGLEISFRPHDQRFDEKGKKTHPKTRSFFGKPKALATESELRRDAFKWENCLHAKTTMRGDSLRNPVFDIHYNARLESRSFSPDETLSYAMVITLRAKKMGDLYNQIVRRYRNILDPIKPIHEIPLSIQNL